VVRFDDHVPPHVGGSLALSVRTDEEHAFNPQTGERLG
jgi:multiple sugar transport system ATP-binding protein